MPDINEKLNIFSQIVLNDATKERDALMEQVSQERQKRLSEAEAQIKHATELKVQARASVISGESGRTLSKKLLEEKRIVAARREEMAKEVFQAVREKLLEFTKSEDYLPHLKKLYVEAFSALGNPYDGVIWLRQEDLQYSRELAATLPGRHVTFQAGSFKLGGLIVDCHSKLLRADQSYDTALGDLDGHFAELFGLSLADD